MSGLIKYCNIFSHWTCCILQRTICHKGPSIKGPHCLKFPLPLSVRTYHKFWNPKIFAPKSAGVRIWRPPPLTFVCIISAMDKSLPSPPPPPPPRLQTSFMDSLHFIRIKIKTLWSYSIIWLLTYNYKNWQYIHLFIRLTKSTLALIPLLGIQYLITVFFEFIRPENPTLVFVEKTFELLFTSIQVSNLKNA